MALVTMPSLRILAWIAAGILAGFSLFTENPVCSFPLPAALAVTCFLFVISLRLSNAGLILLTLFLSSLFYTSTSRPGEEPSDLACEERVFLVGTCITAQERLGPSAGSRVRILVEAVLNDGGEAIAGFKGREGFLDLSGPYMPGEGRFFAAEAVFLGWSRYHNEALRRRADYASGPRTFRFKAHVRDMVLLGDRNDGNSWSSLFSRSRACAKRHFAASLCPRTAAFLQAVIAGERYTLSFQQKDLLRRAGAYHVLAISGVHIGLLVMILLTVSGAAGLSRGLSIKFTLVLLLGYVMMVGGSPSSVRAFIMIAVYLGSNLLQRYRSSFNSLGIAAIVILCISPAELVHPGFLLSFSAVAGILLSGKHREDEPEKKYFRRNLIVKKITGYTARAVRISLCAFLAQVPVMAAFFGTLYPVSIVSNLVILPLLGLILPLGFAFLFFAIVCDSVTPILAPAVDASVTLLFDAAAIFGKCRSIDVDQSLWLVLTVSAAAGLLILSRLPGRLTAFCLVPFTVLFSLVNEVDLPVPGAGQVMRAAFVDVGDGDCSVLELESGNTVVIDTGTTGFESVNSQLTDYLKKRGTRAIDLLVLTHAHDDHFGDALEISNTFRIGSVVGISPGWQQRDYADVLAALRSRGIPYFTVTAGDSIVIGSACLEFMNPPDGFVCSPAENDHSAVLRFEYRDLSILFTGDSEACAENGLVERYGFRLESDVLKVGHHGSDTSTSGEFLSRVNPSLAVISCGRAGKFDHPSEDVVRRLEGKGVRVLRTDTHGGILLEYDGTLGVSTSLLTRDL